MKVFKRIMIILGIVLVAAFIILQIVDIALLGFLHIKKGDKDTPKQYMITKENHIDIQGRNQCSMFASAYVLRHFGIEADGAALYENISSKYKMSDGYVYPKGITACLKDNDLKVKYCRGNIAALKSEVAKGTPVIVLIKIGKGEKGLHYVPVVGYDEEYIYIAESYGRLINSNDEYYNRRVKIDEFKKLWKTADIRMPFYSNTFFSVEKK